MAEFCQEPPQVFENTTYDSFSFGFTRLREGDGEVPMRGRLQSPTEKEPEPCDDLAEHLRQISRKCTEGFNEKEYGEILDPQP